MKCDRFCGLRIERQCANILGRLSDRMNFPPGLVYSSARFPSVISAPQLFERRYMSVEKPSLSTRLKVTGLLLGVRHETKEVTKLHRERRAQSRSNAGARSFRVVEDVQSLKFDIGIDRARYWVDVRRKKGALKVGINSSERHARCVLIIQGALICQKILLFIFATDVLPSDDKPMWFRTRCKAKQSKPPKFPPDKDIELWLKHNAPLTFQQLADIRYSLYHRCSRADFAVVRADDDQFDLTGRHSRLRVINDRGSTLFIGKLRLLGRKRKWINALPRTKKPRKSS